jgi:transposase-like protein
MAKTEKEYLDFNADYCPFCDSSNISGGDGEFQSTTAYRNILCKDCGEVWTEEFSLTGVTELKS